MSRLGKRPIAIPSGVEVKVSDNNVVSVKGSLGSLETKIPGPVSVKVEGSEVKIERHGDAREDKSMQGLANALVRNMVEGVSKGYKKELQIEGVGFKAEVKGQKLVLLLGFASPIEYTIPEGIKINVDRGVDIKLEGIDKQKVGEAAAVIRSYYPVEPYKGKGIRYKDEHVRRKVGKTVA